MHFAAEPDTIDELIADCADIARPVRERRPLAAPDRAAASWTVDEACYAQVADLDEYV